MDLRGELAAAITDLAGSRRIDHAGHDHVSSLRHLPGLRARGLPGPVSAALTPASLLRRHCRLPASQDPSQAPQSSIQGVHSPATQLYYLLAS
jgi:hypothetical protein